MDLRYTLTDEADPAVQAQILAPLRAYNQAQAGDSQYRPLVITLRDRDGGPVLGGLWGATGYGWLFTQLLAVPDAARGQGVGTRLMQMAETEAKVRGCHSAWLDTFEFQARPFYEGLGYVCFGELPGYPTGFTRFFMKKTPL